MLDKYEKDELDKIADRARMQIYKKLMESDVLHTGLSAASVLYVANRIKEKNENIKAKYFGNG